MSVLQPSWRLGVVVSEGVSGGMGAIGTQNQWIFKKWSSGFFGKSWGRIPLVFENSEIDALEYGKALAAMIDRNGDGVDKPEFVNYFNNAT